MEGPCRRRVVVYGRVQGVWFRAACRREAEDRGVAGWIRNLPDGAVEAAFEGPDAAVEAMVAWMRRGPDLARVDRIVVRDEAPTGERGFVVHG